MKSTGFKCPSGKSELMNQVQISDEIRKAIKWTGALARFISIMALRIFLRLVFVGISLFLVVGGGCFVLKSYPSNKNEPDVQARVLNPQSFEARQGGVKELSAFHENNISLENQIRSGRSQIESWSYTVRSVKRDIEGWFKK